METKRQRRNDSLEELISPGEFKNLQQIRVLVVGAGGLGCEILKNLAFSGFRHIDVIDMDTIELTNLNRQFLFRDSDIGKPKAEVAVRRVEQFIPRNAQYVITPHVNRIEEMPDSFYEQFHIVVCGLDSIQARRWINAKLVSLCFSDPSPSGLRPLIDGGSEGFRGQSRVILPGITACYECTLDLLLTGENASYPLCTIASIPRLPEHCIEWARTVRWPHIFGSKEPNFDDEGDMQWLFEESQTRAAEFNIEGVTLELVYGVLKRIVPAIASTNAIIAASCCTEALKIAAGLFEPLDNYMMYAGDSGVFSSIFKFEKRDDCLVCGSRALSLDVAGTQTLESVLRLMQKQLGCSESMLPSVTASNGETLFMASPPALRARLEHNLGKPANVVFKTKSSEVAVTHPDLPSAVRVYINISS